MKKTFWLFLEPYSYIAQKGLHTIIYNTHSHKLLEFKNSALIAGLSSRLCNTKNNSLVKISSKALQIPEMLSFVSKIRKYFMGDIIDTSFSRRKPVQISPHLTVYSDIQRKHKEARFAPGLKVSQSLMECTIYINNTSAHKKTSLKDAHLQFLYPVNDKINKELDFELLKNIIEQLKPSPIHQLNILGGDILEYSKLNELVDFLFGLPLICAFFFHIKELLGKQEKLPTLLKRTHSSQDGENKFQFNFIADKTVSQTELLSFFKFAAGLPVKKSIFFVLENEEQYRELSKFIYHAGIKDFYFRPYYNGKNKTFFKKYVYIKKRNLNRLA